MTWPDRIDSHCHVFASGGLAPPPAVAGAAYSSPTVDLDDYRRHLAGVGASRGVLVQPSSYGTADHSILLDLLQRHPDLLRGVACLPPETTEATLSQFATAGVVATRVQDGYPGGVPVTSLPAVASLAASTGWHVEIWTDLRRHLEWIGEAIAAAGCPVVIDHLGYFPSDVETDAPVMTLLLELLTLPHVWVTLSGEDRLWPADADQTEPETAARHRDRIRQRVRRCLEVAPDRCLWGTDWPHVGLATPPSDQQLADRLHDWIPEESLRQRVSLDNPARLYGFSREPDWPAPHPVRRA